MTRLLVSASKRALGRASGDQSARALLDRLLDRPSPQSLVQSLPAETLVRLIERVGLEDLGDVLVLLSSEQLSEVLDVDLWQAAGPGQDERFDAERFALWLALLVEQSPALAAEKLSELDFDLVALALSRLTLVIDIEQLACGVSQAGYSEDDEQLDKLLENGLHHELEQYRVIARDTRLFDAVLAVLLELNTSDYGFLCELLARCCTLSTEYIEDNGGLYEVLSASEMIASDVAAEREERREQRGFVPPSSARAFFRQVCEIPLSELVSAAGPDPITRAHLRASSPAAQPRHAHDAKSNGVGPLLPAQVGDAREQRLLQALEQLVDAPVEHPRLTQKSKKETLLTRALRELAARDRASYERCVVDASYLANLLLAGTAFGQHRDQASQAAEAALLLAELGADELGRRLAQRTAQRVASLTAELASHGLVKLFRVGLHLLLAGKLPRAAGAASGLGQLAESLRAQGLSLSDPRARRPSAAMQC